MAFGTTDLRLGWFCDHAPGRGKIITGGTPPGGRGYTYFEVQLVASTSSSKICVGIANTGFNISNPQGLDLAAGAYAGLNGSCFASFGNPATANADGWSGGTQQPSTHGIPFSAGDWIGVAIDTAGLHAWWRNASAAPNVWYGGLGALTPNPATGVQGYAYDANAAMSGNIFALLGGGNENAAPFPSWVVNFGGSAFAAALPGGFTAWGAGDTLNPSDKATQITLSGGNLSGTTTAISGSNQPTAFVRSVGHWVSS